MHWEEEEEGRAGRSEGVKAENRVNGRVRKGGVCEGVITKNGRHREG